MVGSADRTRLVMTSKWLKQSDGYMRVNDTIPLLQMLDIFHKEKLKSKRKA